MAARFVFFVSVMRVVAPVFIACTLLASPAVAQTTRTDLLFALNTAVKERDREGILACFNFDKADESMRRTIENAVNQICRWPTSHVFATDRSGDGPLRTNRDGKVFGLNGEWQFQVHIFLKKEQPSKGFVFPAGRAGIRMAILLLVEQPR